jgi:hypothetical protein
MIDRAYDRTQVAAIQRHTPPLEILRMTQQETDEQSMVLRLRALVDLGRCREAATYAAQACERHPVSGHVESAAILVDATCGSRDQPGASQRYEELAQRSAEDPWLQSGARFNAKLMAYRGGKATITDRAAMEAVCLERLAEYPDDVAARVVLATVVGRDIPRHGLDVLDGLRIGGELPPLVTVATVEASLSGRAGDPTREWQAWSRSRRLLGHRARERDWLYLRHRWRLLLGWTVGVIGALLADSIWALSSLFLIGAAALETPLRLSLEISQRPWRWYYALLFGVIAAALAGSAVSMILAERS